MKKFISNLKEDFLAYILLFSGLIFRLFYIFNFTKPENYLWSDAGEYDNRALEMAKGIHIMFSTYWPPFFHIFLSWIYKLLIWLGLENQRVTINVIFFALLYIIAFWCIYQIAKKLFSKKIALVILLILILWYPFIFLNAIVMSENLFLPLAFLGLYFLITKPSNILNGFLLGLFWGLAVITRPIFALTLPFFIFWGLYYKINWKFLLSTTIASSIIIFSMMTFNFLYTNGLEKSVSSSGGFNFAMTWCDTKSVKYSMENGYWYWFGSAANIDYPEEKIISTNVPFENQKYYYNLGWKCINEKPWQIVKNIGSIKKCFTSHLFPTTTDMLYWELFRLIFKFLTIIAFIGSILTIIGLLRNKIHFDKNNKKYLYLFAIIIVSLFIIIYLQNVGEERYIIPYSPILIMLSVPFFSSLINKWRSIKQNKNNKRIWLAYIILLILTFSIFKIYSITVKEAYIIYPDNTKKEISLPFQKDDLDYKDLKYKIVVNSNINQKAKINIAFDDVIDEIVINNKILSLNDIKNSYNKTTLNDWRRGYLFDVPLKAGQNIIIISGKNLDTGYSLKFKQKPSLIIWMLISILIGLPLTNMFIIFIRLFYEKNTNK